MKRRILACLLLAALLLSLCSCSFQNQNSTFRVQFIDVGQGDAALVECDGHYMLIDGGNKSAGSVVQDVLAHYKIHTLDILAISHLHEDHFAGLTTALDGITRIRLTICNAKKPPKENKTEQSSKNSDRHFAELESQIISKHSKIQVPQKGKIYNLGSASVEVLDIGNKEENDSLVLLITYGKTKFLFTGDIEKNMQDEIYHEYNTPDGFDSFPTHVPLKINVIKMPHHGSYTDSLEKFLCTFMPEYAVISTGNAKMARFECTISTLEKMKSRSSDEYRMKEYFLTNKQGDIIFESNGKEVRVIQSQID